jgi:hypothetical protein
MPRDAFSDVMGDRHGATRPVDEGANDPKVIPLRNNGDDWRALLLREHNELLLNIAKLGLTDGSDESRELIINISCLLVYALRENPQTSDEELDDIAAHGLKTFLAMPREQWPR